MKISRPLLLSLSLLLFVSFLSGCASMRAASAERQFIDRETTAYVHVKPLEEVFPEARKILFTQGYQVRDATETSLETEYSVQRDHEIRYLVTATQEGEGWRIHFTKDDVNKDTSYVNTERDLELEWLLIQRVDPTWAKGVKADAQAAGVAAGNES